MNRQQHGRYYETATSRYDMAGDCNRVRDRQCPCSDWEGTQERRFPPLRPDGGLTDRAGVDARRLRATYHVTAMKDWELGSGFGLLSTRQPRVGRPSERDSIPGMGTGSKPVLGLMSTVGQFYCCLLQVPTVLLGAGYRSNMFSSEHCDTG